MTGTAPAQGLTARVMQGVGAPTMILPIGADPHFHSMRPSDARALGGAQLVVWIGEAHTPWLEDPIKELARDAKVLELMGVEGLHVMTFGEGGGHDHGHDGHADGHGHKEHGHDGHADGHGHGHDGHADAHGHKEHGHDGHADGHGHAHGDGHGDGHGHAHADGALDTHAWLDPENTVLWLGAIADALAELDPANAEAYRANAAAGGEEIMAAAADAKARISAAGDIHLVTAHDAWRYFAEAFEVEVIGAIGDSHARAPGAARITELRDLVAEYDRVCVLTERTTNPGLVEAMQADGQALAEPNGVLTEVGADYIPVLLGQVATAIEGCLAES
ncbi:MAG: zinc ABC transporter substrate-binding protein [Pseudomonadota bacterium]